MRPAGVVTTTGLALLLVGCGQREDPTPTPAVNTPPAVAPAPTAAPVTPTSAPTAEVAVPTAGDVVAQPPGAGGELGPFEPSGEPLALEGLVIAAAGARPYLPLGLQWNAVSALLAATPGLRVREHVGFYPPRPLDLTGRPVPYTFGHANALSRPGTWQPAPDATFVLVPYHHEIPSLAIYAPAGEGLVRFVTKFVPAACEQEDREVGFMLTRRADNVHAIRRCGASAEVTTYRAEAGKLAARVQTVDAAAVAPAGAEPL